MSVVTNPVIAWCCFGVFYALLGMSLCVCVYVAVWLCGRVAMCVMCAYDGPTELIVG